MAVKQAAHCAAIHDSWKGLVGFWKLDVGFQAILNTEAFKLQAVLVLWTCEVNQSIEQIHSPCW